MTYCKVAGCRFPQTHTTSGHKCGKCNRYGHGRIECGVYSLIERLRPFHNDRLPESMHCTLVGCKHAWSHNKHAHNCHKCFRNHRSRDCIIQSLETLKTQWGAFITDQVADHITNFLNDNENKYIKIYVGMGCDIFFKKTDSIQGIFMHSDSWGQYGFENSDAPLFENFIEGKEDAVLQFGNYLEAQIEEEEQQQEDQMKIISCPLCRTKITHTLDLKGSGEKCKVCLENDVELFFPECSHAVVCKQCYKKLD